MKTRQPESAAISSSAGSSRATSPDVVSVSCNLQSPTKWLLLFLPFGYLWFRLSSNLWFEWTTNPQYGYGLLVPFLCLGLLVRRWHAFTEIGDRRSEIGDRRSAALLFAFLAFLYLPTRLIEASTPEWRPIQWLLGIEAIGLTLCAIDLGKGRGWLRQLAFPILFFFVAIPWPSPIETPIIQALTRMSASITIEVLGWLGVPAMAHGNVIEVATGMVGIDEACSGIRSFQSSIMISLFFGEFYALSRSRRWLLVPAGFVFSMAFNVCRMALLTLIAAKKGVPAISQYHDPAGITIAIACTVALWGLAILLRSPKSKVQSPKLEEGESKTTDYGLRTTDSPSSVADPLRRTGALPTPSSQTPDPRLVSGQSSVVRGLWSVVSRPSPAVSRLAFALLVWLCIVEAGVQLWYRHLESQLRPNPSWSVVFPEVNPTFRVLPIGEKEKYLLRFDEGKEAEWAEADGTRWQVFYCSWLPGRVAGYLAKRHTPETCLQATGLKMVSGPELTMMNVHGVELPVRSYVFDTAGGPINVFHCRWEAGVENSTYVEHESARFNLIRGIWAGRGNKGQKVLEIIISGYEDSEQAKQALGRELEKMIKIVP